MPPYKECPRCSRSLATTDFIHSCFLEGVIQVIEHYGNHWFLYTFAVEAEVFDEIEDEVHEGFKSRLTAYTGHLHRSEG